MLIIRNLNLVSVQSCTYLRPFHDDGVTWQEHFPQVTFTGRGEGRALFHGVEGGMSFELCLERLTASLQLLDVRYAIGLHLAL